MPQTNKTKKQQLDGDQLQRQQNKQKKIRRIHERVQMPTDKTQLIQFLSERIKQAEDALNDTQQLLETEVNQRQKISKAIDQRNKQLQKLYEVDQKGLPQKIKQKLTEILTQTINQKIQAEEELNVQKIKNYEYKARYEQLKWQQSQNKHKLQDLNQKEQDINAEIVKYEGSITLQEKQLKELEEEFEMVREKKQTLEDKFLQMKVALERMNDIKAVINRFFSNEDLFDEKMDLKEQKVVRVQVNVNTNNNVLSQTQKRLPSRDSRNVTKLKPLNNSRKKQVNNDDEDFWKGDFSTKTRNF